MTEEVKSPCVSVCYIDDDGFCQGCFRTGDEISRWSVLDNQAKKDVLQDSQQRRKAAGWLL